MQLAAYSFDESGDTAIDAVGGHDFALTANAARVPGHVSGGALQPSGATAVPLPDIGRTVERTVCMWIKGDVPDGWAIEWHDPVEDSGAWGILFNMDDVVIQGRNGGTFVQAKALWPDTTNWHHVSGTFGGNSVKLYLDGVLADQVSLTGPITAPTNAPTMFGGWTSAGSFDDLRIYDTALGQSSITAAMAPITSTDLASAADLSVDEAFLARVKAAMQQYGVAKAKTIYATGSPTEALKAEFNLARNALRDPVSYAEQFAWAIGTDTTVDSTVDDDTIRTKVQDAWPIIAGSPF
ncbi:LamG domain-containing protein [Amycolatopsis speibonae]|uniref:LamG domain-containing protein n=1 Tax=Amycolatopsis speibonae TaxID=1450224 RepID=A0ABV7P8B9_9PSEU